MEDSTERIKVYILEVKSTSKGPKILVSNMESVVASGKTLDEIVLEVYRGHNKQGLSVIKKYTLLPLIPSFTYTYKF